MLGKIKIYAIATLLISTGFLAWQWRSEIQETAKALAEANQLRVALSDAEREAERQADIRRRTEIVARARADEIEKLRRRERALSQSLRELEENDEQVADWADNDLPDAIVERLQAGRGDAGTD